MERLLRTLSFTLSIQRSRIRRTKVPRLPGGQSSESRGCALPVPLAAMRMQIESVHRAGGRRCHLVLPCTVPRDICRASRDFQSVNRSPLLLVHCVHAYAAPSGHAPRGKAHAPTVLCVQELQRSSRDIEDVVAADGAPTNAADGAPARAARVLAASATCWASSRSAAVHTDRDLRQGRGLRGSKSGVRAASDSRGLPRGRGGCD